MKRFSIIIAAAFMALTSCTQKEQNILVAYFSATGTTEAVAKDIAAVTGGDIFEISPTVPYTAEDLDWRNKQSRSSIEMTTVGYRTEFIKNLENPDSYALYDILMIDSHILGLQNIPLYEPDETTTAPAPQWIIEPKHTVHTGQATYYTIGSSVGYYDLNTFARNNGLYTCAFNKKDFTLPIPAGAYLRVTNQKNGSSGNSYVRACFFGIADRDCAGPGLLCRGECFYANDKCLSIGSDFLNFANFKLAIIC